MPLQDDLKPTILCLQGGGTTGTIFNIQTIRLRRELDEHFNFTFIDAPFECGAGPNVLPVFEGAGPFKMWRDPEDPKNNQAAPATVAAVQKAIDDQIARTGKGFVGVMGFSEGARLAAGIALGQQVRRAEERSGATSSESETDGFLFVILLNATTPPLTMAPSPSFLAKLLGGASPPKINLPSIHVIGKKDQFVHESRNLATQHFDERNAKILELECAHHLPTVKKDSEAIALEIVSLYHRIIDNF